MNAANIAASESSCSLAPQNPGNRDRKHALTRVTPSSARSSGCAAPTLALAQQAMTAYEERHGGAEPRRLPIVNE
jgi:hypothetical protein